MRLTEGQEAVVAHGSGPARVTGGYATGKTAALRARAERLAAETGHDRLLVVAGSADRAAGFGFGATTFGGLALGIVARAGRPRRTVEPDESRAVVAELLGGQDAAARWPALAAGARHPEVLDEIAQAVSLYQASWLGLEELRTHAEAAGQAERWEELHRLTRAYLAELGRRDGVDWAGALVKAGLALRKPDVAAAERARFDHVIVDDFHEVSFAAYRLLATLTGPGADVTVAGNPDAPSATSTGGDRTWFDRFARSFGAELDVLLPRRLAPEPEVVSVGSVRLAIGQAGPAPSSVAAIVPDSDRRRAEVIDELAAAGISTVASIEGAVGRTWPVVIATGFEGGQLPAIVHAPRLLDAELFKGPDVPTPAERAAHADDEARRRTELVRSRATERLVVVDGQMAV